MVTFVVYVNSNPRVLSVSLCRGRVSKVTRRAHDTCPPMQHVDPTPHRHVTWSLGPCVCRGNSLGNCRTWSCHQSTWSAIDENWDPTLLWQNRRGSLQGDAVQREPLHVVLSANQDIGRSLVLCLSKSHGRLLSRTELFSLSRGLSVPDYSQVRSGRLDGAILFHRVATRNDRAVINKEEEEKKNTTYIVHGLLPDCLHLHTCTGWLWPVWHFL